MAVNEFLNYLTYERNYSTHTVHSYGRDLNEFQTFFTALDSHLTWESIDTDVIRNWMETLMDKGNAATTIARRLSALRSFFRFALSRNLVQKDPARSVRAPKKKKVLPQFVRENEMDALLDHNIDDDNFINVRARTIILMFYTTGLRLSELISLNDAMVDLITGEIKVTGKRNKQRVIPFGEELREALLRYKQLRDEITDRRDDALFVTPQGNRMNANQVRYLVQKQLKQVTTMRKRSPHVLRHSFATAMVNHDAGLESVKKLLGHESLSTTEIYTHTTFEQLRKIYENAHPRA